jgi:hypothetical protein
MKKWQIWMEGYVMTGMSQEAYLIGEEEAETFREACDKYFSKPSSSHPGGSCYNSERLTVMGCRLYDNEADSRKFNG